MNTTQQFETPILFLLFNRPETTRKVFERIRSLRPRQLFVAADGPREGSDSDFRNCASARLITQNIDWRCEVKYRFLEKNYGFRSGYLVFQSSCRGDHIGRRLPAIS